MLWVFTLAMLVIGLLLIALSIFFIRRESNKSIQAWIQRRWWERQAGNLLIIGFALLILTLMLNIWQAPPP